MRSTPCSLARIEEVSSELVNFLKYVENTTDDCVNELADDAVQRIHNHVKHIKESRDWRRKYMRFEELLRKEYKQGSQAGETRMQTLIIKMVEAGETDKLSMLSDKVFLQEMYRKYNL